MLMVDVELRRRWSQLPEPLERAWAEQPMLVLDRGKPWMYGPVECDPGMTGAGLALPRPVIRWLRELARLGVPFQRLAIAHELDPGGPVAGLLPGLRAGPRICSAVQARALVGPPPAHPLVRRTARMLDALVSGTVSVAVAGAVEMLLDPILFGVVGQPDLVPGAQALFYPLAVWLW